MSLSVVLLIVAVAIVLVLSVIAGRLLFLLHKQQQRQREAQRLHLEKMQGQREQVNQSIQILLCELDVNELTLTQASIRIASLLDSLQVSDEVRVELSAFYQLRERTAHIPILSAWTALDRRQQKAFAQERLKKEATYGDFVRDAARRIIHRHF